ncbi:hypothetical protein ACFQH6_11825 [Halobacteriaceae archaeon GCM10025711]
MTRYEATFDIDSKTDAHSVRLLVEQIYNVFREELRETGQDDAALNDTLQTLEEMREESRRSSPGSLTIIFEQHDESFDN